MAHIEWCDVWTLHIAPASFFLMKVDSLRFNEKNAHILLAENCSQRTPIFEVYARTALLFFTLHGCFCAKVNCFLAEAATAHSMVIISRHLDLMTMHYLCLIDENKQHGACTDARGRCLHKAKCTGSRLVASSSIINLSGCSCNGLL